MSGLEIALVGLVLIGPVILFAGLALRARRLEAERLALAERNGWTYQGPEGTRRFALEGVTGDVPWRVEVTRGRGKNASVQSRFESPAAPTDGVVLVGPKIPSFLASLDLGGSLVQTFLQQFLGPQAAELAHVRPVEVGSEALRAAHTVLATDPALAGSVLTPAVERLLLEARFPSPPILLRWRHELVVRVHADLGTPAQIEQLVALGVAVRDAQTS